LSGAACRGEYRSTRRWFIAGKWDVEMGDLEMGDLEMGDLEMGDLEMGDLEMGAGGRP